jgi:hypothetical protein
MHFSSLGNCPQIFNKERNSGSRILSKKEKIIDPTYSSIPPIATLRGRSTTRTEIDNKSTPQQYIIIAIAANAIA